jgi:hypothetical protein
VTSFWLKAIISGLLVAAASALAKRSPAFGALIVSLPLTSVLAMIWLWRDQTPPADIASFVQSTLWYILPSLPMFLLIPLLLRRGVAFWPALVAGCGLTVLLYFATTALLSRFGVRI